MGIRKLSHVTVIVRNHDEALRWYTEVLGMEKRVDDSGTIPGFRWLTVGPRAQPDLQIVLLKARDQAELTRLGHGTMWILEVDDYRKTYQELSALGVKFVNPPDDMPWGVSAVFLDLYGNPYNLVEPR